jgi:hypothetical protein
MKKFLKLYLRPFLFTGLIFGLLLALWEYIDNERIDFVKLIIKSVAFGALMSWSTVAAQKRRRKEKISASSEE